MPLPLPLRVIILACVLIQLGGCRYWSMVRFAYQFCDYDQHITVTRDQDFVQLRFHDPVLPEPVFARYFKATPFMVSATSNANVQHHYRVAGIAEGSSGFEVMAEFTPVPGGELLAGGRLDAALSAVFSREFADGVLRAACSQQPDLGMHAVSVPMTLAIPESALPTRSEIETLLSRIVPAPRRSTDSLQVRLDFIEANGRTRQGRPIDLHFGFQNETWQSLAITYDQYSLWLDFAQQRGLLYVVRR